MAVAMHSSLLVRADYQAGTQTRVPIPRQHFLHRLRFRVNKGAVNAGAFVAGAANKLIARMELSIGGQLTKDNLGFEDIRRLNLLQYKDNPPSDGYAYLDLGRLPTHAFTSLELLITWASVAQVTTGGATAITGAYVEIRRTEELNVGQPVKGIPLVLRKTLTVDAGGKTEAKADLRSGNILQAILIVPSDPNLIQSVSVVQDGVKYHLAPEAWADLQEENKADFELDAVQTDFAVLNFDKFGEGSQALRTAGMNTLEFIFATANIAGATIRLVPIEIASPQ
jgi:hypothetical protein